MNDAPIGVFDSGVGGISVLHDLRRQLPHEDVIYYADSGYCPYGGRAQSEIVERAINITDMLLAQGAKLIVVACNTATIAAVEYLRATYAVPFIGMEPAIKPAIERTRSGVVAVLATGAALAGERFHRLLAQHTGAVRIITQPCPGLVELVEMGDLAGPQTRALVEAYTSPLLAAGVDTLVLGCTHYPFLRPLISEVVGPDVILIDTGAAVARQTARVLEREQLLTARSRAGTVEWHTSGDPVQMERIVAQLWGERTRA